jgi:hypothetical protein
MKKLKKLWEMKELVSRVEEEEAKKLISLLEESLEKMKKVDKDAVPIWSI